MPTRRVFFQSLGALSLVKGAITSNTVEYSATQSSIEVFNRKVRIQSVASDRPASILLHSQGRLLLAANNISEYQGLPTASIESYAVDPFSGRLSLVSRQALSLSATGPIHLALSPDGKYLVVPAFEGGVYNVLPVTARGELGPPTQVLKEIGCGVRPRLQASAHPHSVAFHPSGDYVIGTDFGSDRVNVFAFRNGMMTCIQRFNTTPGSGPAHLTIDASGTRLRVRHLLTSSVEDYQFDSHLGRLSKL